MSLNVYLVVVGRERPLRCVSLSHAHSLFNRYKARGFTCFVEVRTDSTRMNRGAA